MEAGQRRVLRIVLAIFLRKSRLDRCKREQRQKDENAKETVLKFHKSPLRTRRLALAGVPCAQSVRAQTRSLLPGCKSVNPDI